MSRGAGSELAWVKLADPQESKAQDLDFISTSSSHRINRSNLPRGTQGSKEINGCGEEGLHLTYLTGH